MALKIAALVLLSGILGGCRSGYPDLRRPSVDSPDVSPARYTIVHGWPEPVLPDGHTLGQTTGVGVDSHNHVFVFHRAGRNQWPPAGTLPRIPRPTVEVFDGASGKLVARWGADKFVMPHSLTVDDADNVWITDIGLHQVMKFSHDGTLLLAVGAEGVVGDDSLHFGSPTDVAVLPDGSFYVADGYLNSRVVKFAADGRCQFQWGIKGTEPGQLQLPHGVTVDRQGRVYVADRGNSRIQVFDDQGRFVTECRDTGIGRPYAIGIGPGEAVFVVDAGDEPHRGESRSRVIEIDQRCRIMSVFGRLGRQDGQFILAHAIAIGADGAVYVADAWGDRIQKFVRR